MKPEFGYFKQDKKKFFYTSIGNGFPTIFIPGWMAMPDDLPFDKILNEANIKLLEKHKIIFLQLSNFYRSSLSSKPYDLNDYADELKDFLDNQKITKINLIGHSAGCRHVLFFANKYPDYINKLVLMNAAGFKSPKLTNERLNRAKFYFAKFFATPSQKEKILKPTFENLYTSDLTEIIPSIKHKTLIIWGEKDTEMNVRKAYKFNELLPNNEMLLFENMGHMTIRQPDVYTEILKFLNK